MRFLLATSALVLLNALSASADSGSALYPPGLQPLITKANVLLSSGQFHDAVQVYTEAIEQAPTDYLLFYKRATASMSLNRHLHALDDFDKVLELTSNTFDKAYLMKGRIHAKEGRWADARDALSHYRRASTARGEHDSSIEELGHDISEGEQAAKKAEGSVKAQLWEACAEAATRALRVASHSVHLRQLRAECFMASGDIEGSVGDLTRLMHISSPSTSSLMRTFRLSYFLLPPSKTSMSTLKQCLTFDPDSKPCLQAHRLVKKLEKAFTKLDNMVSSNDWRGVIKLLIGEGDKGGLLKDFDEAMATHATREHLLDPSHPQLPLPNPTQTSPRRADLLRTACRAYTALNLPRRAHPHCEALLSMSGQESDIDGLVGKGEYLLASEEWEEAVRMLEQAFEAGGKSDRTVLEKLQKAQKLLKQSKQKDYYKILGVARDADTKTIKKAFRTAAKTAHPDKGGSEAKMAAVNEAYELLTNPELRARFDAGDDPNDPMAQSGGHPFAGQQHPFAQFFQHGQGNREGGFQFHFSGGGPF